jgi:phage terminase large subunit
LTVLRIETPRVFAPLLKPSRYKGAHGGRGSGKSHFFAELLVETAILQPGLRALCGREIQKSLRQSVKLLVEDKIRGLGLIDRFEILETEIRTPGGGVISFQGLQNHTVDSIKSLEGFDIAWIEEAQSLSQRSLDLLRPTIRKPGSELWFSWNPNKPDDPIDVLLRGETPPRDAIVVQANYSDNPWFPEGLRADMEDDRARDPDKYQHVWNGAYSLNSEARVFRNWKVEPFETPKDAIHRFGADWGFAIDPTVLVRCHIEGRKLFVDAEVSKVGCEIDATPALFDTIEGSRKFLIRADSARPETVSFMRRQGFKITEAIKGPGSIEDGIEFLRSFDIVVHPRCVGVERELTLFSYKTDKHTGEILPFLDDKNNHFIDALRYALEELRRSGYRPAAQSVAHTWDGPHRPAWRRNKGGSDSWKVA